MDRYLELIQGIPGETVRLVGTDAVQQIAAANYTLRGIPASACFISCEDNNVRYAFMVNPTQGANPVGHLIVPGEERALNNGRLIIEFRFINAVALTVGVLQVTPYYEVGT